MSTRVNANQQCADTFQAPCWVQQGFEQYINPPPSHKSFIIVKAFSIFKPLREKQSLWCAFSVSVETKMADNSQKASFHAGEAKGKAEEKTSNLMDKAGGAAQSAKESVQQVLLFNYFNFHTQLYTCIYIYI